MASFDWCSTFLRYKIYSVVNTFYDVLHESVIDCVQNCGSLRETSYLIRFSKEIKGQHSRFKFFFNVLNFKQFSFFQAKYNYESKKYYTNYIKRSEKSLKNNPYDFWKFVTTNVLITVYPRLYILVT